MKKYLVLYMAPLASFDKAMKTPPEEMKGSMDAWNEWMEKNKEALVDMGAPLGKTKKVTTEGATDTRNMLGGYSIMQAGSLADAAKLFGEDHPHFGMEGGWVEVVEFVDMPGM